MTTYKPCMETDGKAQQIVTCPIPAMRVSPSGGVEHLSPDLTWTCLGIMKIDFFNSAPFASAIKKHTP